MKPFTHDLPAPPLFGALGNAKFRSLLDWVYTHNGLFPLATDLMIWPLALAVGAFLRLDLSMSGALTEFVVASLVATILTFGVGKVMGVYRDRWRRGSFHEVVAVAIVWSITSVILVAGTHLSRRIFEADLPSSAIIFGSLVALWFIGSSRFIWRILYESLRRPDPANCRPTIVFGAGEAGDTITRAMLLDPQSEYYPVALLDDDPSRRNREISGVKVRGSRHDLAEVVKATGAEIVLVAVGFADSELILDMSNRAAESDVELRVLPPASELVGKMSLADVRHPTVDDLLGRASVEIDLDAVADYVRGRRVLVTGAGGSIGSELSAQLHGFDPSDLFLLDRDENALHSVQMRIEGRALLDSEMLIVADIRDRDRMFEIMGERRPDVVFHAAALKHLTLLENHPHEGIKTNALGTRNLLDAAAEAGVQRFVNISTDKAADPTSVLGSTKLAAERLTALTAARTGLPYVSVRFGNVLGSRGSVLPTFLAQIENGGPVTVTHRDVSRYFMTIPEAVRLVVQAGAIGEPGEVMVLDMGEPVKIVDLAQQLINMIKPDVEIEYTGLRPGEKLHEALFSAAEIGVAKAHPRITHTNGDATDPFGEIPGVIGTGYAWFKEAHYALQTEFVTDADEVNAAADDSETSDKVEALAI